MTDVTHIPLAEIDAAALIRDRVWHDPEADAELEASIAASGLRTPVEVYPLETPADGQVYGLIAGWRRLRAVRALAERTGEARYAAIPAYVRERRDMAALMAAMVEENEIRANVSLYERGRIAMRGKVEGVFDSVEAGIAALYPHASKQKRARLRTAALVAEELDDYLTAPETLRERQLDRIARAILGGFDELMRVALEESSVKDPAHQWGMLASILREAEENERNPEVSHLPGRPRRVVRPRYGLTVRRERIKGGWVLHFTGRESTGPVIDLVLDEIVQKYMPG